MDVGVALGLFVGLPCVGKSSYAKKIVEEGDFFLDVLRKSGLQVDSVCFKVFCFDDEVDYSCMFEELQWKEQRRIVFDKVEEYIVSYKNNIENRNRFLIVLLDDNMYYKSMRHYYYSLSLKHHCAYFQIVIQSDLISIDFLIEEDNKRSKSVGSETIIRMAERIQYPNISELWESNTIWLPSVHTMDSIVIVNQSFSDCIQRAIFKAKDALEKNIYMIVESDIQTSKHNLELSCRKVIGNIMQGLKNEGIMNSNQLRTVASKLNEHKKKFLNCELRTKDDLENIFIEQCNLIIKNNKIW